MIPQSFNDGVLLVTDPPSLAVLDHRGMEEQGHDHGRSSTLQQRNLRVDPRVL